jgi:hypothetical protein
MQEMQLTPSHKDSEGNSKAELADAPSVAWNVHAATLTFCLMSFTTLWTLLLTFIPVLVDIESGTDEMYTERGWYSAADILRIVEPVGGMPLAMGIMLGSGFLKRPNAPIILLVFTFGGTLYVQGAAFHSASVMFKHAVELYDELYGGNSYITDILYWMRTVWEHIISHYVYAIGYAIFAACIAYVFRDHELETVNAGGNAGVSTGKLKVALLLAAGLYGILLSGVAIDFPSGCIVGIIYLLLYGFGWIGFLLHRAGTFSLLQGQQAETGTHTEWVLTRIMHKRPVLFYYFLSHAIALGIIIIWIIAAGGFYSRSEAANK